ncbi:uncharacterized protein LOC135388402 [Ornithodoros turicata]|uniref:uncharacterized protein LOC135388402 n=1 Tax=Ornithodoros turicata TaxID=34597 RepID=UPI0031394618
MLSLWILAFWVAAVYGPAVCARAVGEPGQGYQTLPCHWVEEQGREWLDKGVIGGHENGRAMYVGRISYQGGVIPGKIIPWDVVMLIGSDGKEAHFYKYQALECTSGTQLTWIKAADGKLPTGALQGGNTSTGELLYIGRVHHNGTLTVGKLQTSLGCVSIGYFGKEYCHSEYEVLVWPIVQLVK